MAGEQGMQPLKQLGDARAGGGEAGGRDGKGRGRVQWGMNTALPRACSRLTSWGMPEKGRAGEGEGEGREGLRKKQWGMDATLPRACSRLTGWGMLGKAREWGKGNVATNTAAEKGQMQGQGGRGWVKATAGQ